MKKQKAKTKRGILSIIKQQIRENKEIEIMKEIDNL